MRLNGFERCARQREINQQERFRMWQMIDMCRRGDYSRLASLEYAFERGLHNMESFRVTKDEMQAWRDAADAAD